MCLSAKLEQNQTKTVLKYSYGKNSKKQFDNISYYNISLLFVYIYYKYYIIYIFVFVFFFSSFLCIISINEYIMAYNEIRIYFHAKKKNICLCLELKQHFLTQDLFLGRKYGKEIPQDQTFRAAFCSSCFYSDCNHCQKQKG